MRGFNPQPDGEAVETPLWFFQGAEKQRKPQKKRQELAPRKALKQQRHVAENKMKLALVRRAG